jgi:hypothetical protein
VVRGVVEDGDEEVDVASDLLLDAGVPSGGRHEDGQLRLGRPVGGAEDTVDLELESPLVVSVDSLHCGGELLHVKDLPL